MVVSKRDRAGLDVLGALFFSFVSLCVFCCIFCCLYLIVSSSIFDAISAFCRFLKEGYDGSMKLR